MNPWKIQAQYIADFDKIKCLDVTLVKGQTIQIPAYWWYSIKFSKNTSISCFRYRTYMNNAAISPHIFMYALQLQNVKRDSVKKHDITALNKRMNAPEQKEDNVGKNNDEKEEDDPNKEIEENVAEPDSTPISQLPN
jgi:hypothetical protein